MAARYRRGTWLWLAVTGTVQLWADGSGGCLLTRVCRESSLALCRSESIFSMSRGSRNCRKRWLKLILLFLPLCPWPCRAASSAFTRRGRGRKKKCNRQNPPHVQPQGQAEHKEHQDTGVPVHSLLVPVFYFLQSCARSCSIMKCSLCSRTQTATYLSKLWCGGQYSSEAKDQIFSLDAMWIVGGLEGKYREQFMKHPRPAIS